MKSSLVYFLLVLFACTALFSCQTSDDSDEQDLDFDEETYPNESFYNQRAYPYSSIKSKEAMKGNAEFKALKSAKSSTEGTWEEEGPYTISGRITDIAISPESDDVFYAATAQGGVLKTTDRGTTWEYIWDDVTRGFIGDVTVAPSDPNRVYVGTGEANGSATSGAFFGDGVWRSDDAGETWTNVGLENSNHIGRIVVNPINEDELYAAVSGVLYDYSEDRGVYKSSDGGSTWERKLFVTDSTSCADLAMHPENPDTLFAAMWERTRRPWARDYGGVSSGIHRSFDGGETWELLTNGLPMPADSIGRIGVAIAPSQPNSIYASVAFNEITNVFGGLYRSDDLGDNWYLVDDEELAFVNASFGWYFGNIRVNPNDEDDIHVLGQRYARSQNLGETWSVDEQMHVDFHAMEFGNESDMILSGTDGGLYISEDNGENWELFDMPITQFYHIEVDELNPDVLLGGTQDNNTLRRSGVGANYDRILGGDGFHVHTHPVIEDVIYAESQWGNHRISFDGGLIFDWFTPPLEDEERTNWNTPTLVSPADPYVFYYGSNRVWKNTDFDTNWELISDDLTQGLHPSGSMAYGTLTTLAGSYQDADVIYTGSDDGQVHVTADGGATWTNISDGLPDRYVTGLAVDALDHDHVYLSFSGFQYLDYESHIFETTDGGQSWLGISGDLPNAPVNDVLYDSQLGRIFLATDHAVYLSANNGESWEILGENLPELCMMHLQHDTWANKIYVGTFGRSIFSFDLSQLYAFSVGDTKLPQVKLYPNPAQDELTVQLTIGNFPMPFVISDVMGRELKTGVLSSAQQAIDVKSLAEGRYILNLDPDGANRSLKFIISR